MIRIRQIILKENIFEWVLNPKVSKVVLSRGKNKTIEKPALCVAHVFHHVDFSEIAVILGACKVLVDKNREKSNRFVEEKHLSFLTGVQSLKFMVFYRSR